MTAAGSKRTWYVVGLAAAAVLCGSVALAMVRLPVLQFELGYAYEIGSFHGWRSGFAQNHRKAAHWLERAARANHPRAQYMLGILTAHGWGISRDGARATEWFIRSARNGYAPACYHLGWMYHRGDGVPRDEAKSRQWLEQAATHGMAAAAFALGGFHERGEGASLDGVQALEWYAVAMHFARTRPGLFSNAAFAARAQAAYDVLISRLDYASVRQAEELAHGWLASHPQ